MERNIDSTVQPKSCPIKIPQLGFGVYLSPEDTTVNSCLTALKVGYRHIDTAQYYGNEKEVGVAVSASKIPRDKIVICTKILGATGSVDGDYAKCKESIDKIGGTDGYVDIFLIHSPHCGRAKRQQMWQALERLYEERKARSIGVSNFGIQHIEELKGFAKIWPPHVNQLELHPWCQQKQVVSYCEREGIAIQAYCPIVRNQKASDPTLLEIAVKHQVAANQVLIRYSLQRGWIPLPKSDNAARIAQNADVYGFNLSESDMESLDRLDQGVAGAVVEAVAVE